MTTKYGSTFQDGQLNEKYIIWKQLNWYVQLSLRDWSTINNDQSLSNKVDSESVSLHVHDLYLGKTFFLLSYEG